MSGPERSSEQIFASARAWDQARAKGVPDRLLGAYIRARAAWWGRGAWPGDDVLIEILNTPALTGIDETLTAAIRRRLRG